jgi:hypothetical protein
MPDQNSPLRDYVERRWYTSHHLAARTSIGELDHERNLAILNAGDSSAPIPDIQALSIQDGQKRRPGIPQKEMLHDQLAFPVIFPVDTHGNPRNASTLMRKAAISLIRQPCPHFLQPVCHQIGTG